MTDNELKLNLTKVAEGDEKAFEAIYEDMKTPIMTVIFRIVQNKETAEDLLQEVFIKLYLSPPKDIAKPRAYIFKTANNMALDMLRAAKDTVSLDDYEGLMYTNGSGDPSEKLDIERALAELDSKKRQIVTLHINVGLKFREIAEILGIPLGTAIWKYHEALNDLRGLLS